MKSNGLWSCSFILAAALHFYAQTKSNFAVHFQLCLKSPLVLGNADKCLILAFSVTIQATSLEIAGNTQQLRVQRQLCPLTQSVSV